MALPTNYFIQQQINASINPYSSMNMSNRNINNFIRDRTLDRTLEKFRKTSKPYSSGESNIQFSQNYINATDYLYSNFKNKRQRNKAAASLNSKHGSLSSRSIKVASNIKKPLSLRRILLSWFCMR